MNMKPLLPDITVNGEPIPATAIAAEAQNHDAPVGKPGLAWKAAAKAMVVRALLLQRAAELGLTADPQDTGGDKWETDDEALIRAVLEHDLELETVSEETCRAIYDSQTQVFRAPSLYQPAHILFAADPADAEARAAARLNAKAALADIQRNPKSFASIAKDASDCPSKANGGMLGQVGSGDTVPEFEAILDILKPGQLHPHPVETRYGFHIVRMDEKAEGAILPFDAVRPQIQEKLEQVAWAKAAQALTEKLVANAKIVGIELSPPET